MHRGIELLEESTPSSLEEAIRCFEEAIRLRESLPWQENNWYRHVLAAGWMNRGDALSQLGGTEKLAESLRSYDTALVLLDKLPPGENPLFQRRTSIAWINRGTVLQKLPGTENADEAIRSFRQSIQVLETVPVAALLDHALLQAAAWVNLAASLVEHAEPRLTEARLAAEKALGLIRATERRLLTAAQTGLKARHVLCQVIAAGIPSEDRLAPAPLAEATDLVDEALVLIAHWESADDVRLIPLATAFFTLGCFLYRTQQPQFLAEFILETLDPAAGKAPFRRQSSLHQAASDALWQALRDIQRQDFAGEDATRLARLAELREVEKRLAEWRNPPSIRPAGELTS